MPDYSGRSILIKVGDNASSETFTSVGGLRAKTFTFNNNTVDVSNATDGVWRKLLSAGGIRSMSVSGSGVFQNDTAVVDLEGYARDGTLQSMQLVMPNADQYAGEFQVTSFELSGEHDGEQTYSVSLESSGSITKT